MIEYEEKDVNDFIGIVAGNIDERDKIRSIATEIYGKMKNEVDKELSRVSSEKNLANQDIAYANEKIEHNKSIIEKYRHEIESLKSEIINLKSKIQTLTTQKTDAVRSQAELVRPSQGEDESQSSYSARLNTYNSQKSAFANQIASLDGQIDSLKKLVMEKRARIDLLNARIQQIEQLNVRIQSVISTIKANIERLNAYASKITDRRSALYEKMDSFVTDKKGILEEIQNRAVKAQSEMSEVGITSFHKASVADFRFSIGEYDKKIEELNKLRDIFEDSKEDVKGSITGVDAWSKAISELTDKCSEIKEDFDTLKKELTSDFERYGDALSRYEDQRWKG